MKNKKNYDGKVKNKLMLINGCFWNENIIMRNEVDIQYKSKTQTVNIHYVLKNYVIIIKIKQRINLPKIEK